MHFLLIHQYFLEDNAGGGSRWNEMARIWVQEGHSVTVIAGDVHYMMAKEDQTVGKAFDVSRNADGVLVIRCKGSKYYHNGFLGRFWSYFSFAFMAMYAGMRFANSAYKCIIITSPPLLVGIPGLLLSKWKRIPLVLEIRDLWPESAIEMGVLKNKWLIRLSYGFEKYLYRKARLMNVLTPAFRECLIREKEIDPGKIVMIPNAADFRWSEHALRSVCAREVRAKLGLEEKFVIIYVGAHGLANDLMQLVEAATLLRGTEAHFLLIGDGMQKKMLIEAVHSRDLANVSFLDPVSKEQVFEYILAADAGVAVLKNAAIFKTVYSNKTFDYLSCKKPVLMAIDGVSRDLVEQADAGVFAEPGNPADLARKIRIYMDDRALLRKQGENGYRLVHKHFDREKLAREFLECIESQLKVTAKSPIFGVP
ncbi:glycosyltransferase involved in cell wall biosynthesis [Dyadobacter sp. BE34]|uniref:Glycosyltransferase involved in cell wall biosynthesis n=1 Tax=Dyadobacter fermentans TaxID=94254 RepID=A0ABU1R7U8_9BACT|nr:MULTISPECIES: glycosyltransferase family 4 protein [Dyadobacter]MDR6809479.1 glycosyltransferase involved in cell wall biosynthesis [Dyadobacter fermentans]MDR7047429.1 glycosyltransferase involved in cell wall biosynthesis [Dyadobacter sp. BE242]MDR7195106.1 glycosyltransferase involved in cell wall biosynthesis [Dyadobacter sp. BE34]MDR7214349.1 glycosyltransferase involved in cell wall biosynthesis [Dyadobacter sp. BE31]MDR7267028.1 glycosyltransferase involved in cell wall biosynthesis 